MYRSDKKFMSNPATASSRIYIGFLGKGVVAADLEEKFKYYGNILGIVQQVNFAFIQYENEAQAQAAIKNENGSIMNGRKISVKQAMDKGQRGGGGGINNNNNNNANNQFMNKQPFPQAGAAPPPLLQQNEPPPPQLQNSTMQFVKPPELGEATIDDKMAGGGGDKLQMPPVPPAPNAKNIHNNNAMLDQSMGDGPAMDNNRAMAARKRRNINMRDMRDDCFPLPPPPDAYRDNPPFYGRGNDYVPPLAPYNSAPAVVDQPDRNDCEIIVVSKPLTKYAEYIEQRLKTLGLIVDLLFPNEDVPIGRVLANISSRGCLFAILVMPQNEEHRSLTLNILHGIPQEHRNMPIEDALILIVRNFHAYMHGDKSKTDTQNSNNAISDRHPTAIQMLLNLLAENRQITSTQYDKLLIYLQERRELQHKHELEEGIEQNLEESNSKQVELQSRIMNILNNKTSTVTAAVTAPATEVTSVVSSESAVVQPTAAVAPPLLKDPSVQKALDSLLGGDMFKNIGAAVY